MTDGNKIKKRDVERLYDEVLTAIERKAKREGVSFYQIALDAGVGQSILSRLKERDGFVATDNLLSILMLLFEEKTQAFLKELKAA